MTQSKRSFVTFWSHVDKSGGHDSCWLWTGPTQTNGYGRAYWGGKRDQQAHRVSWQITNGLIPQGLHVCHRCDNKLCVNPEHLFLGTDLDNAADKVLKGRQSRTSLVGELNGQAKLTVDTVRKIRELASKLGNVAEVSRQLDLPYANVYCIIRRKSWTHV